MPKRKHSEDEESDKLLRKIRRLEKKMKKRKKRSRRHYSTSSISSISSDIAIPSRTEDVPDLISPMLYEIQDEIVESEPAAAEGMDVQLSCTEPTTTAPLEPAPTHQVPPAATAETAASDDRPSPDEVTLDEEILSFLGEAPSKEKKYGPKLQNEIANRWEHVAISGVTKEARKEFLEKYLTPENCKLIDPPALNLEVKAALSETLQKKDTAIQNKQKQISAAVSCVAQAVKRSLSLNQMDPDLVKLLIDAGRIICDLQHTESTLRRGFIGSFIKKEVKEHLNDTQIDKYLFGEKLADTLKAAKSINKSGSEIRAGTSAIRPIQKTKPTNRPLNSRGPPTTSRLSSAGRRPDELVPVPAPQTATANILPTRRRAPPPPPPPLQAPRSQQRPRAPRR